MTEDTLIQYLSEVCLPTRDAMQWRRLERERVTEISHYIAKHFPYIGIYHSRQIALASEASGWKADDKDIIKSLETHLIRLSLWSMGIAALEVKMLNKNFHKIFRDYCLKGPIRDGKRTGEWQTEFPSWASITRKQKSIKRELERLDPANDKPGSIKAWYFGPLGSVSASEKLIEGLKDHYDQLEGIKLRFKEMLKKDMEDFERTKLVLLSDMATIFRESFSLDKRNLKMSCYKDDLAQLLTFVSSNILGYHHQHTSPTITKSLKKAARLWRHNETLTMAALKADLASRGYDRKQLEEIVQCTSLDQLYLTIEGMKPAYDIWAGDMGKAHELSEQIRKEAGLTTKAELAGNKDKVLKLLDS